MTPSITAISASRLRGLKVSMQPALSHHKGIEVPGRTATDPGMVGRVDKVRSCLEGLDFQSPCGERCHDTAGNGCLSAPAVGPGYNDPGYSVHGFPRFPCPRFRCAGVSIFTVRRILLSWQYAATRWFTRRTMLSRGHYERVFPQKGLKNALIYYPIGKIKPYAGKFQPVALPGSPLRPQEYPAGKITMP